MEQRSTRKHEAQALQSLQRRLTERYRDRCSPQQVHDVIDQELRRFDDAGIRDFVPLLVENRARSRLEAAA
ncbi:three-helix bundle dimerization domain-containing protein [Actinomadura fibrosa]|uniref:Three-helix bundle dimerization domain-containing protein n=1 Tax=Actinomadura fibrosa TaxID=111802 RepID=A0ABW2XNH2_9ACTN|nr:hypothetical protein [Actinomadura fibrosa]